MATLGAGNNNQGIMHLKAGDRAACGNRRAYMCTTTERFATDTKRCRRCEAIFNKRYPKGFAPAAQNAAVAP